MVDALKFSFELDEALKRGFVVIGNDPSLCGKARVPCNDGAVPNGNDDNDVVGNSDTDRPWVV